MRGILPHHADVAKLPGRWLRLRTRAERRLRVRRPQTALALVREALEEDASAQVSRPSQDMNRATEPELHGATRALPVIARR